MKPLEAGVLFWVGRHSFEDVLDFDVRVAQLGIGPSVALSRAYALAWSARLRDSGVTVRTVFAAYEGEDYADIPTVQRTVGFVPPETRDAREARTYEVIDFAGSIGAPSFACHIGAIAPHDHDAVLHLVRRIADRCAAAGLSFALETGQETAPELLRFMDEVARPNLGINFDPANMILYGTGDPIEAFELLAPQVVSVHAKDGVYPPKSQPEALGAETPLGQGAVDFPRFVSALKGADYSGQLFVEREGVGRDQWVADVGTALNTLARLAL
ncbi:MAG TPA: sugar phosphate isomerase/epimerase family protein [Candidatus Limnocylindrales bacterium]|nr:sugar phosphate isomerase/epimerase family protein [Candidatus Limnocylindrales bacterium]